MIMDFEQSTGGGDVEADVVIAGAGPAGLSVADAASRGGLRVCILEAGGRGREEASQALYQGENVGVPYFKLHKTRLRQFGGSAGHWNGRCAVLDEIDFAPRPWVPESGWPFTRAELEPYYERARAACNLQPVPFDEGAWERLGITPPALDPARVRTDFWQFSRPTPRFTVREQAALLRRENVRALLHASVVEVQLAESGTSVAGLIVAGRSGRRATVRGRVYVMACGGLETPRLLLASNGVQKAGVGNGHDLVGRFFMEHPHARVAYVESPCPRLLLDLYRKHFPRGGCALWPCFRPSDDVQRRHEVLNTSVALFYEHRPGSAPAAVRAIYDDLAAGRAPSRLLRRAAQAASGLHLPAAALYRRYVGRKAPLYSPGRLYLLARAEQAPNRDSRVTLGDTHDALGVPRLRLDWRLSPIDARSLRVLLEVLDGEFARLGLGRVQPAEWLADDGQATTWPQGGGHHHMGTTRMSADPSRGVVDPDGRVHGVGNLYVAGSSVFPTGGWANPTLTIVALSLRLGDHLARVWR